MISSCMSECEKMCENEKYYNNFPSRHIPLVDECFNHENSENFMLED